MTQGTLDLFPETESEASPQRATPSLQHERKMVTIHHCPECGHPVATFVPIQWVRCHRCNKKAVEYQTIEYRGEKALKRLMNKIEKEVRSRGSA